MANRGQQVQKRNFFDSTLVEITFSTYLTPYWTISSRVPINPSANESIAPFKHIQSALGAFVGNHKYHIFPFTCQQDANRLITQ